MASLSSEITASLASTFHKLFCINCKFFQVFLLCSAFLLLILTVNLTERSQQYLCNTLNIRLLSKFTLQRELVHHIQSQIPRRFQNISIMLIWFFFFVQKVVSLSCSWTPGKVLISNWNIMEGLYCPKSYQWSDLRPFWNCYLYIILRLFLFLSPKIPQIHFKRLPPCGGK